MVLRVRDLTAEEQTELQRRVQSRTEPVRMVERARMVWLMAQGQQRVPAVARQLGVVPDTVRRWVQRFNAQGLAGLADQPRTGRPPTYTPEQVSEVLVTALTQPDELGLPFGCWTLDRLTTYLHERSPETGGPLPISRSHIDRLLHGEGLRWRTQERWFGERVDPNFAEKRGSLRRSARRRPRTVWWWTWTKWARRVPKAPPA